MPRKRKLARDDPAESERFIAVAKEVEADSTGKAFEREFAAIARKKPVSSRTTSSPNRSKKAAK